MKFLGVILALLVLCSATDFDDWKSQVGGSKFLKRSKTRVLEHSQDTAARSTTARAAGSTSAAATDPTLTATIAPEYASVERTSGEREGRATESITRLSFRYVP